VVAYFALAVIFGLMALVAMRRRAKPQADLRVATSKTQPQQSHDESRWSERRNIFTKGALYRVLKSDQSLREGEELTFDRFIGYSRYDSCHVYAFLTGEGREKEWWFRDDAPFESWQHYFLPL
jgi:hypothetical protein